MLNAGAGIEGARDGEEPGSCSKDVMRRLLLCGSETVVCCELLIGADVGSGIDVVRMWIGRNGFLSRRGESGRVCAGAMFVGVAVPLGDTAAEEKWSDGEAGSYSSS